MRVNIYGNSRADSEDDALTGEHDKPDPEKPVNVARDDARKSKTPQTVRIYVCTRCCGCNRTGVVEWRWMECRLRG